MSLIRVRDRIFSVLNRLILFVAIIIGWEASVRLFAIPSFLLPAPSDILVELAQKSQLLVRHAVPTIFETVAGFFMAAAIGYITAIIIVHFRFIGPSLYALVVALNSFPKVTIAPILVVWFGLGIESKVLMTLLVAYFPIAVNSITGLYEVESELLELAQINGASDRQILFRIRMPNSLPHLFTGLEVAMPLAMIGAVISEFVGAKSGLGFLIMVASSQLEGPLTFAAIVTIAFVSTALFFVVTLAKKFVIRWTPSQRRR